MLAILALLAACFAVYAQTLGHGFINFDDPGYVYDNPHVIGGLNWMNLRWAWTAMERSNWHPLTWISLMADAQLFGANAGGYHLTNLLLHAANSALLFLWLRRAAGEFWPSGLAALLFAIHPLHVESVAWIAERKDVLSVFFCLLTLLAYTRYAHDGGRGWYGASLALFALGLTAKPMLVTLPALLLLIDRWPLRRTSERWQELAWEKAPFFTLSAASAVITMAAQRAGNSVVPYELLSLSGRFVSAVTAAGAYLGTTFWPVGLGVYYPYWAQRPWWQPALACACLAAICAAAWRWRKQAPYFAVGWAWFCIALLPVIGVVQVGGQAMADRYTYLPHIGLFMALAWGAEALCETRWRPCIIGAAGLGAAACLPLAVRQASFWKDGATLFAHTFQVTRPSVNLCMDYGDACLGARRYAEAQLAYQTGLKLHHDHPDLLIKLGLTETLRADWAHAVGPLSAAVNLRPDDEGAVCNYGRTLVHLNRNAQAVDVYQRFLRAHPDSTAAHVSLANTFASFGQWSAAAAQYDEALALQPDDVSALYHRAWMLALGGGDQPAEPARALELARRAVELTPGGDMDSLDSLAGALAANGRWTQAAAAAGAALQVAQREKDPAAVIEVRQERLALYQAGQMPQR